MTNFKKIAQTAYRWWMKFAHRLAVINTTILLTVVYLILLGVFSLFARLFGKDLLKHRIPPAGSFWLPKEKVDPTMESSRRQF